MPKLKKKTIREYLLLLFIFLLAFSLRTYRIENPVADWHSWRQADTAMITRNFIKDGFTPFFPKFDALYSLNWPLGDLNPNRYFLAEFPLYNILVYPLYLFLGINPVYSRLVSIFFSSLTTTFLYLLVKKYSSSLSAFFCALFYAVLPFSIYYGRVIMADPLHIFLSVLALYLFTLYLEKEKLSLGLLASLTLTLALLTKPYALVLGLPIFLLFFQKYGLKMAKKIPLLSLFLALSLVPFLLWRYHLSLHPEGQFGTAWLINSTAIRFTPAFFRWIISERLIKIILGGAGFALFFLGLLKTKSAKENLFYFSYLTAIAIYISYIATGNVTHDYYQLPLLPPICIFLGLGSEFVLKAGKGTFQKLFNLGLLLSCIVFMLLFSWYIVKDYFNVNHWAIVHAGQKADQILPPDAKVIAPYNKDPAFLYQLNRLGWTFLPHELDVLIEKGATHYVSVNYDDLTNQIMQKYQTLEKNDEYVIIDLTHPL
jgi:dolichyl-phosphate-mannose--protein O-mannosyl transferase